MGLAIPFYLLTLLAAAASAKYFTNGWSVQISSNSEAEAERVASEVKSIMKSEFLDLSVRPQILSNQTKISARKLYSSLF